ncbi:MAG: phosphate/phosphite/phosphonate ABC transporter substrate-binding protein [Gallionellaceae bacterium]|nr:phosphate/phosphite/phosphonate ABC transporter substrate-binding protein [Gallionellaceae bacterium]
MFTFSRVRCYAGSVLAAFLLCGYATQAAAEIKIGIMQAQKGDAQKFKPLVDYLKSKGVDSSLVAASTYSEAAKMFSAGQIDAMFSGSGVAGSMIIKEVAKPVLRPVNAEGISTYWAVVIAAKGAPAFNGDAAYFSGKRVVFTALASSGEIYYHALPDIKKAANVTIMKAASHGAALDTLSRGMADIAIVKNRVWDKESAKFATLVKVGEDKGENPDNTLIVSVKMDGKTADHLAETLMGMNNDTSELANQARSSLGMKSFVRTTAKDFEHNLAMLKRAGVDKNFEFDFH